MEPPPKKKTLWSAFVRYKSKKSCLLDYDPPEGYDTVPLIPQEKPSEEEPKIKQMVAPRIQRVHKPVNSLKRDNLSLTTQRTPTSKRTLFDLHKNHPRREHLNKRQETGAKSQNSKAFSKNIIDLEELDTSSSTKSRYTATSRPAQSPNRKVSRSNVGTMLLDGVEEFQRVERQVNPSARLGARERQGRSTQTNRSSDLLSKPYRTVSSHGDKSQQKTEASLRTRGDSEDSVLDTDLEETIPMSRKSGRKYPQVIINESMNGGPSLRATPQSMGIGSFKQKDSRQDSKPSNDSQSDCSTDMNEQVEIPRERRQPLKRKIRHSIDVGEDELAHPFKQPRSITQSRSSKDQVRTSNTGKIKRTIVPPLKTTKQDSGTSKYRVISVFSETRHWLHPQIPGHWFLHQDCSSGALAVYDEQGTPIHELIFKPQNIQKIQRSPGSEKLIIHKHKDVTGKGSTKIFLELITANDARQICNVLKKQDSAIGFVALEEAQLDQQFLHNRRLADSMLLKRSQVQIKSKIRTVDGQSLKTEATQEQGRGQKSVKQQGNFVDGLRNHERKDEHDTFALGKRKRHEDITTQARKGTVGGSRKIRSSNTPNNDGSLLSVEDSPSISPESFYGNRSRSPASRLADSKSAIRQPLNQRSPSPVRWTEANQNWDWAWKSPIIYPQGEKRSRTVVEKEDIERLDDGQFLNDNIINFYLCWLEHHLREENPKLAQRIYFHNTFFYKSLTKVPKGRRGINYEAVERWTSKVDLLAFDYIIVPVNEHIHWYVAIICNAPKLQGLQPEVIPGLQSQQEGDRSGGLLDSVEMAKLSHPASRSSPNTLVTALMEEMSFGKRASNAEEENRDDVSKAPIELKERTLSTDLCDESGDNRVANSTGTVVSDSKISHKDKPPISRKGEGKSNAHRSFDPNQPRIITLDSLGLKHPSTCTNLKNYLVAEIKSKRNIDIPSPGSLGMTALNIPQQTNYVDCGVFLLSYIEHFLKRPDELVSEIMQAQILQIELKPASFMRGHIRQILLELQEEQDHDAEGLMEEKCSGNQPGKAENELGPSQEASNSAETVATCHQTHPEGRFPPGELHQAQHNIDQSDTAAHRQEGTPEGTVDVDEISRIDPVSDCKSNALINSPMHTFCYEEKCQGQPRSSSRSK